ncbi:MAG: DNA ligase [Candidatus Latescibacterota bacterium]|nr:MAG: DNA ligase [Candidatus Latescibacterota bacterium]
MHKYPRTHHLEGSRLQPGDEDLDAVPLSTLRDRYVVIEEKVDGANSAICFDGEGQLRLQSRGHFLVGGPRERQFDLLKAWAQSRADELRKLISDRYVLYGEWSYAKHTVFYDALPHYFLEFDVLDTRADEFLSTARRRELLNMEFIASVPVLFEGILDDVAALPDFISASHFKSPHWRTALRDAAAKAHQDPDLVARQSDPSDAMEGLYVKIEEEGGVVERYKFIRHDFLQAVRASESHWMDRPLLPNRLAPGVELF